MCKDNSVCQKCSHVFADLSKNKGKHLSFTTHYSGVFVSKACTSFQVSNVIDRKSKLLTSLYGIILDVYSVSYVGHYKKRQIFHHLVSKIIFKIIKGVQAIYLAESANLQKNSSIHQRSFYKRCVLRNFANSQENTCARVFF